MRASIGWVLLVVVICLLPSARASAGVSSAPSDPRDVELIASNQPGFEAAIDVGFPGFRDLSGFESIRPFVAILHNNSGHGIKAYVVKWNVTGPNGRDRERTLVSWVRGGRDILSGERIVCKAGEARVMSPMFNWGVSSIVAQGRTHLLSALAAGPLAAESTSALRVDVSLDAVVYDDGVFVGQDESNFHDRYESERNGERDEATSLLQLLNVNASDDQIIAHLNTDIDKGRGVEVNDRPTLLYGARSREARTLLTVFNRRGRLGVREISLRLVSYERTVVRKQ